MVLCICDCLSFEKYSFEMLHWLELGTLEAILCMAADAAGIKFETWCSKRRSRGISFLFKSRSPLMGLYSSEQIGREDVKDIVVSDIGTISATEAASDFD